MRSSFWRLLLILLICVVFRQGAPTCADEPSHGEFVQLASDLDERMQQRFRQLAVHKIVSPKKAIESFEVDGLAPKELNALLRFEQDHPSTHLGLMALRKIVLLSGRFGLPPRDVVNAKTEALRRLPAYASQPILAEVISHLADSGFVMNGYVDRQVGDCLRAILRSPAAKPSVLLAAKLKLCDWILSFDTFVQHRETIMLRLEELKNSDDAESIMSVKEMEFFLPVLPTDTEYRAWKSEANQLLAALAVEEPSFRIPVVHVAGHPDIVRIDVDATVKLPTIAHLARKRVRHRVGSMLEDFQVTLLDGTSWKLSEQRDKLVVIQFSFTGCAPCKRMYPSLQKLSLQFPESLSVLTIMKDEDSDTSRAAVSDSQISWPVVCDSERGGLTDRWGIESFPTVFIIDGDGHIVSIHANENDELEEQVSILVKK